MSEYFLYQSAGRQEVDGGTVETYVPVSRYQIAREVLGELIKELDRPRWFYDKEIEAIYWLEKDQQEEE